MRQFHLLWTALVSYYLSALLPGVSAQIRPPPLNCTAQNRLVTCPRPRDFFSVITGQFVTTGQFACRRRYVQGEETVRFQTLCLGRTNGLYGKPDDLCGCCGGNCPRVCSESCAFNSDPTLLGVYIYDWYSFTPKRFCVTEGRSLQVRQQNPARWMCEEWPGWFNGGVGNQGGGGGNNQGNNNQGNNNQGNNNQGNNNQENNNQGNNNQGNNNQGNNNQGNTNIGSANGFPANMGPNYPADPYYPDDSYYANYDPIYDYGITNDPYFNPDFNDPLWGSGSGRDHAFYDEINARDYEYKEPPGAWLQQRIWAVQGYFQQLIADWGF